MTWRIRAKPIIARILEATRGQSEEEIRRALYDEYPFGERNYHPYKIWLDEIKVQRGLKPPTRKPKGPDPDDPNQGELF